MLAPTLNVHVQQKETDAIKKVQQNYPGHLFEGDVPKEQGAPEFEDAVPGSSVLKREDIAA